MVSREPTSENSDELHLQAKALHLPHFNLYDGRTEFSSAAPAA